MTAVPGNAGGPRERGVPGGGAAGPEVDVRVLAGRQPPKEGVWLRVTAAEARPGGGFAAVIVAGDRLPAGGGDVLVQVVPSPGWWAPGGTLVVEARVWACVAGSLLRVAAWSFMSLDRWPEAARGPVVFALGALRELRSHGADTGSPCRVALATAAGAPPAPFPVVPVRQAAQG